MLNNKINHLPEVILERDKEQRVLRSRATQTMSDIVTAQKHPGPLGSPIFKALRCCSLAMCHRHKAFVAPCTDFKSMTPNSQFNYSAHPIVGLMIRDTRQTIKMVDYLKDRGILSVGLKYPIVPRGDECIRFQISADHTRYDLDYVLKVLEEYKNRISK